MRMLMSASATVTGKGQLAVSLANGNLLEKPSKQCGFLSQNTQMLHTERLLRYLRQDWTRWLDQNITIFGQMWIIKYEIIEVDFSHIFVIYLFGRMQIDTGGRHRSKFRRRPKLRRTVLVLLTVICIASRLYPIVSKVPGYSTRMQVHTTSSARVPDRYHCRYSTTVDHLAPCMYCYVVLIAGVPVPYRARKSGA